MKLVLIKSFFFAALRNASGLFCHISNKSTGDRISLCPFLTEIRTAACGANQIWLRLQGSIPTPRTFFSTVVGTTLTCSLTAVSLPDLTALEFTGFCRCTNGFTHVTSTVTSIAYRWQSHWRRNPSPVVPQGGALRVAHPNGFGLKRWLFAWRSLFLSATAYALDPTKSVYQFNCQNWTHQNGLPSDGIDAIRQTQDGYIWLGTHKGLVRFDGSEFKVFNASLPGQPSPEIRTLAPSKDGGVWFGTNNGNFGYFDGHNFSAIADEHWNVANMRFQGCYFGNTRRSGLDGRGARPRSFRERQNEPNILHRRFRHGAFVHGVIRMAACGWAPSRKVSSTGRIWQDEPTAGRFPQAASHLRVGGGCSGTNLGGHGSGPALLLSADLKPKQIPLFNDESKSLARGSIRGALDRHNGRGVWPIIKTAN